MFRLIWVLFWVYMIGCYYGENGQWAALGFYAAPVVSAWLVTAIFGVAAGAFTFLGACLVGSYYMVTMFGWGFFLLFLVTIATAKVNVERYQSGHIKSISGSVGP